MISTRWRRRLIDAVLVILTLVALLWMARHTASYDDNRAPFYVRGGLGETLRGRDFAVTVERIELARALDLATGLRGTPPERRGTDGVWLVAHLRVDALERPLRFQRAELRTRSGRYYSADEQRVGLGVQLRGIEIAPGIAGRGVFVFELPRQELAGVVLEASRDSLRIAPDSVIEIDLGLSPARTRALLRAMPDSLLLRPPGGGQ